MKHLKQRGLTLIELLVALSIGSFLIIGAVTVQSQTRNTFTMNENQSRLQETARYALSVLESDTQLASLWGYSNIPYNIVLIDTDGARHDAIYMMPGMASTGVKGKWDDCGVNESFNVLTPVSASDGAWKLGCPASGNGQIPGTDTLTVRRTGTEKVDPEAGRLQFFTDRLVPQNGKLILNGKAPQPIVDDQREFRDYFMRTYYVAQDAEGRPNLPAMRVLQLTSVAGAGAWDDQEVVRGVEDIQIELGVDPGDPNLDGVIKVSDTTGQAENVNGNVGRWVTPGDDILKSGQVVAVRIWVRVRAEEPEAGFSDQRAYNYASVNDFTPSDGFRRVVMSRTIFLRNTRMIPQD